MTVMKLVVTEDGAATDIQVISSHGDAFDQAAVDALRRCKFDPATLNSKPVPIHIFARVRFFEDKRETFPRILAHYGLDAGQGAFATRKFDKPPVAIYIAPAEFSDKARKAKVQGVVLVSTVIDEQGNPTDIKVVKSLGMGLDEKAIESVHRSRFQPATKDGVPIAARITMEVNFRLY
jgi:TonB family protein